MKFFNWPASVSLPKPAALDSADARFARCVAITLAFEGGYVDHPSDPGGATNLGITITTLAAWRGRPVTKEDVRHLKRAEAEAIYRKKYWDAVRGDELPAGVDLAVWDYGVNSGPHRSIEALQEAVGTAQDGLLGVRTLAATRAMDAETVVSKVCAARLAFVLSLPTWPTFGRGWARRINEVRDKALAMARREDF